ncbi:ribosome small subunit-dependent GTPase A [Ekhidna sp.]|uniref:ribosome small subunit-dependent GTPase A n=1 Tax=Ekhidna sp. TaxID=2608089 RepID=UPI003BAD16AE
MRLENLGYNIRLEQHRIESNLDAFEVGRVVIEHKDRYEVNNGETNFDAELVGKLRFAAENHEDLPAVGDWVAISVFDGHKALIHEVYPRHSVIERQAVGQKGQKQIIATNIDYGLIVQSVGRDFNLNRLERYVTICNNAKVTPLIILNKVDLIDNDTLNQIRQNILQRVKNLPIYTATNQQDRGYEKLASVIEKGKTYCLLGSSGVGKSTILNNLAGSEIMSTNQISDSVNKGRHTTTHRELIILANGGILIDNPGMREVGITDSSVGLELTFEAITVLAKQCKYNDCTHQHEENCAVLKAVEKGEFDMDSYNNYQKLQREKWHYESSSLEKKQKDKDLGKLIKNVKKNRKRNKY